MAHAVNGSNTSEVKRPVEALKSDRVKVSYERVRLSDMRLLPDGTGNRSINTIGAQKQILKMIKDFDDLRVGVFTLAWDSDDSVFYILDGQHRYEALRQLGRGDEEFYAEIYHGLTELEQKEYCLKLNDSRRPWTVAEKFRLKIEIGDPDALNLVRIVERNGLSVNVTTSDRSCGRLTAVGALEFIHERYREDVLDETLSLLVDAYGTEEGFTAMVLQGVAMFVVKYQGRYVRDGVVRALQRVSPVTMEGEGRQIKRLLGMKNDSAIGYYLHKTYNYRKTSGRLPDWE